MKCKICGCDYPETNEYFYTQRSKNKPFKPVCRKCHSKQKKLKKSRKKYRENREYREKHLKQCKDYRENNPEKRKETCKRYRLNNKEKIYKYRNQYRKEKRKNDIKKQIEHRVEVSIHSTLKENRKMCRGGTKWEKALDYTRYDLRNHIETLFQEGMTWDNYGKGGWELDHIIPKSKFYYESIEDDEFKKCWALNNLQPLWEKENIKKWNL